MAGHNITWQQPSHPELFRVEVKDGFHRAVSLVSLPAGSTMASLNPSEAAPTKRFTTVQTSPDSHVELKHDFVFVNHSCRPSLIFDTTAMAIRVARERDLAVGDELTFFYPSSEWEMDEPFACQCSSTDKDFPCLGRIQGAKETGPEVLKKYWLNKHIEEMLKLRNTN